MLSAKWPKTSCIGKGEKERERRKEKRKRKKEKRKKKKKKKRKIKRVGEAREIKKQNKTKQNSGEYRLILYT